MYLLVLCLFLALYPHVREMYLLELMYLLNVVHLPAFNSRFPSPQEGREECYIHTRALRVLRVHLSATRTTLSVGVCLISFPGDTTTGCHSYCNSSHAACTGWFLTKASISQLTPFLFNINMHKTSMRSIVISITSCDTLVYVCTWCCLSTFPPTRSVLTGTYPL